MTMRQFLDVAGLELLVQLVERDARRRCARHRRVALLALAVFHDVARLGFVGHLEMIARFRHALQSKYFDGRRRRRVLDGAAAIVKHRANFAEHRAADEEVAGVQRAVLHEDGGHRAAALVHARFQHRAGCRRIGIGLQFAQIRDQQNHFQQLVDVLLLLRGNFHEFRVAAPFRGHQADVGQLALHALRLRFRLVNLVDGHDDGHVRGLGVIDGFLRLRHHAVVGGNHQHHDVRHLRAARAHARKRFVARRVDEHHAAVVHLPLCTRRCAA